MLKSAGCPVGDRKRTLKITYSDLMSHLNSGLAGPFAAPPPPPPVRGMLAAAQDTAGQLASIPGTPPPIH